MIADGEWRAEIAPALGCAFLSLTHQGRDIFRLTAADRIAENPTDGACYPCTPYFGRLASIIDANGTAQPLAATAPMAEPAAALHGEGWISPWRVVDQTPDALTGRYRHDPTIEGRYPYAYEATQKITLTEAGPTTTLTLRNAGDAPMPGGLALHPFFPRAASTRLTFAAGEFWSATGRTFADKPDALGTGAPAPLPTGGRDDTYVGVAGPVLIETARGVLSLRFDTPLLHCYAPAGADFFCLEPVTHLPGAFDDDANPFSSTLLAPGEAMSLSLRVEAL